MSAADSLSSQRIGQYGAYLPSLEAAYTVGHIVAAELMKNWSVYGVTTGTP
jgi:purine nucleoside permease